MNEVMVNVFPMGDEEACALEYEIYLQEGYIQANPLKTVLENLSYPKFVHFTARQQDRVIGSLRLVTDERPRRGIFKLDSFREFSIFPWAVELLESVESRQIFEIGTMVIRPEFRGGRVYTALFQKAFEYALLQRIRYSLATIDEDFFHRLCKRGLPFQAMGERKFYMGSYTVPAMIDVDQLARMIFGGAHHETNAPIQETLPARPAMAL